MFRDTGAASISTYKMVKKFKFEDNLLLTDIPRTINAQHDKIT